MKKYIVLAVAGVLATACATTSTDDQMAAEHEAPAEAEAATEESSEPTMRRHCTRERVSGSNRQRRTCRMVPVN